jgi:uncharacterized protein (TIGR02118 family)
MLPKTTVKMIAFFKRKPGMSVEEFQDYYENKHVPTIMKILAPFMMDYRRNFVCGVPPIAGEAPDCDVITEAWFETRDAFEQFGSAAAKHREMIAQDELKFIDTKSLRMFIVEEHSSEADCGRAADKDSR